MMATMTNMVMIIMTIVTVIFHDDDDDDIGFSHLDEMLILS